MLLEPPFISESRDELKRKIMRGKYNLPDPNPYSWQIVDLVSKMVVVDPRKRYSAKEIFDISYVEQARKGIFEKELKINDKINSKICNPIFLPRNKKMISKILERKVPRPKPKMFTIKPLKLNLNQNVETKLRLPYEISEDRSSYKDRYVINLKSYINAYHDHIIQHQVIIFIVNLKAQIQVHSYQLYHHHTKILQCCQK